MNTKEKIAILEAQNAALRQEVLTLVDDLRDHHGVAFFCCLNCNMPTYTGQGACELCPLTEQNADYLIHKLQVNLP